MYLDVYVFGEQIAQDVHKVCTFKQGLNKGLSMNCPQIEFIKGLRLRRLNLQDSCFCQQI